jgi:hypothetical protein
MAVRGCAVAEATVLVDRFLACCHALPPARITDHVRLELVAL